MAASGQLDVEFCTVMQQLSLGGTQLDICLICMCCNSHWHSARQLRLPESCHCLYLLAAKLFLSSTVCN